MCDKLLFMCLFQITCALCMQVMHMSGTFSYALLPSLEFSSFSFCSVFFVRGLRKLYSSSFRRNFVGFKHTLQTASSGIFLLLLLLPLFVGKFLSIALFYDVSLCVSIHRYFASKSTVIISIKVLCFSFIAEGKISFSRRE